MNASPNWHPWLPCSDQPEESCADAGCPVHGDNAFLDVSGDDEDDPCMKVGCGHSVDDHALDLERGDRLYCQRCECRRYLSTVAMRAES